LPTIGITVLLVGGMRGALLTPTICGADARLGEADATSGSGEGVAMDTRVVAATRADARLAAPVSPAMYGCRDASRGVMRSSGAHLHTTTKKVGYVGGW